MQKYILVCLFLSINENELLFFSSLIVNEGIIAKLIELESESDSFPSNGHDFSALIILKRETVMLSWWTKANATSGLSNIQNCRGTQIYFQFRIEIVRLCTTAPSFAHALSET